MTSKMTRRGVLLALIALVAMCGTVYAIAYVVMTWQSSLTVVANPKTCFYYWYTGVGQKNGTKQNTMNWTASIFPSVTTIDPNATEGIWNWDTAAHNIYFRLVSSTATTADVAWFAFAVNATSSSQLVPFSANNYTSYSSSSAWTSAYSAAASTKYMVIVECKATAGATVGHTPAFTIQMRIDNP